MTISVPLILASRSPRRRRLLNQLGLSFSVEGSPAEEVMPAEASPAEAARAMALQKIAPIARRHPDALTLAADTVVAFEGEVLQKPRDEADAAAMLHRLSGHRHTVHTGLALMHPATDRQAIASKATDVIFGALSAAEIDAYVATGDPMDKAGAYGIQSSRSALFVERIEGDYYNVVGLPLRRLYCLLRQDFGDLFSL